MASARDETAVTEMSILERRGGRLYSPVRRDAQPMSECGQVEIGDVEDDPVRSRMWLVFAVPAVVLVLAAVFFSVRPIWASDGSPCGLAFTGFLPVDPGWPSDPAFNECRERTFVATLEAMLLGVVGGVVAVPAFILWLAGRPPRPFRPWR